MAVAIAGEAPSVSGSVKDPQGRPVAGAAVSLFSRSSTMVAATTSNPQGAYRFEEVAPGDYLLRAEAPGFAVFLEERLHVDASLTRDITLTLAGARDQVVVTASGTSQSADEVSKSVTVIDRSEIEQRDVFPLTAAVDLAPAVRLQTLGGPGQEASIHIRGMRDIDTAVLVDGMRLRDAAILHGDATGLIEDLLAVNPSRVEVLNGAGSSLYGTSAIGGVVNIVTDDGGGRTRGSVLAEGGSLGTMRGRAQVRRTRQVERPPAIWRRLSVRGRDRGRRRRRPNFRDASALGQPKLSPVEHHADSRALSLAEIRSRKTIRALCRRGFCRRAES